MSDEARVTHWDAIDNEGHVEPLQRYTKIRVYSLRGLDRGDYIDIFIDVDGLLTLRSATKGLVVLPHVTNVIKVTEGER